MRLLGNCKSNSPNNFKIAIGNLSIDKAGILTLLQTYIHHGRILSGPLFKHPEILTHYYKNVDLSRLGNPCCPDFPTGTKEGSFCAGLATGTKVAASATWLAHPFVPVGVTNRDKRSFFFLFFFSQFFFYFNYNFAFQLNFCISIKLVYWNSVL